MSQRPSRAFRLAHLLVLAAFVLGLGIQPAAAEVQNPSVAREGGFGMAAAVMSLVYGPVKILYAAGGLALAGSSFLWTWGDKGTAGKVIQMAVGGDYVITPEHLGGAQDIRFTGE